MYQILEICGIPGLKGCIGDSQKVCAVLWRALRAACDFSAAVRRARSARGGAASSLLPGGTAEGKQSGIAQGLPPWDLCGHKAFERRVARTGR